MIDTNLLKFPEEKVQKLMAHYKKYFPCWVKTLNGKDW